MRRYIFKLKLFSRISLCLKGSDDKLLRESLPTARHNGLNLPNKTNRRIFTPQPEHKTDFSSNIREPRSRPNIRSEEIEDHEHDELEIIQNKIKETFEKEIFVIKSQHNDDLEKGNIIKADGDV